MKNLLVPIGSSGNAVNTLQYAIDFAHTVNAKIFVTQVYESTKVAGNLKNIDAFLEEETSKELQEVLSKVHTKNIQISSVTMKGKVLESIQAMSKDLKIDLIVSSAKSVSIDETVYLGRVAGSLVKDIEIPISLTRLPATLPK